MNHIPVIGFSGYSDSGKTFILEKLIGSLKTRGLRVAVIKHHGHEKLHFDDEGKDSWRFSQAGADISIVSSVEKTAYVEQRSMKFQQLVGMVHDVDVILVEGFKREPIPQIGIWRKVSGKGLPDKISRYLAVVTDQKDETYDIPCFSFDEISLITDFIQKYVEKMTDM